MVILTKPQPVRQTGLRPDEPDRRDHRRGVRPALGRPDLVKWMSSDGHWVVELIRLSGTRGEDGDWLRVTHHGFNVGKARDWDGVARLGVDVGDLRQT